VVSGGYQKKAWEKRVREDAVEQCFLDAAAKHHSDVRRALAAARCIARVYQTPAADLAKQNLTPPPSAELAAILEEVQDCQQEAKHALVPKVKQDFLEWCYTGISQKHRISLARVKALAQDMQTTAAMAGTGGARGKLPTSPPIFSSDLEPLLEEVQDCQQEAKHALVPKVKQDFLEWCYTGISQKHRIPLARVKALTQIPPSDIEALQAWASSGPAPSQTGHRPESPPSHTVDLLAQFAECEAEAAHIADPQARLAFLDRCYAKVFSQPLPVEETALTSAANAEAWSTLEPSPELPTMIRFHSPDAPVSPILFAVPYGVEEPEAVALAEDTAKGLELDPAAVVLTNTVSRRTKDMEQATQRGDAYRRQIRDRVRAEAPVFLFDVHLYTPRERPQWEEFDVMVFSPNKKLFKGIVTGFRNMKMKVGRIAAEELVPMDVVTEIAGLKDAEGEPLKNHAVYIAFNSKRDTQTLVNSFVGAVWDVSVKMLSQKWKFLRSRKFGLEPLAAPGKSTPPPPLPFKIFQDFKKLVNLFIRWGVEHDAELFSGKGMTSAKKFYDQLNHDPAIKARLKALGFHNRVGRLAAPFAYFAVREYHRRVEDLRALGELLEHSDGRTWGVAEFFVGRRRYPRAPLVDAAMARTAHVTSRYVARNLLRHLRNLVQKGLLKDHEAEMADLLAAVWRKFDRKKLEYWLTYGAKAVPARPITLSPAELEELKEQALTSFIKRFLYTIARRLGKRVRWLLKISKAQRAKVVGRGALDCVLKEVLAFGGLSFAQLTRGRWARVWHRWRKQREQTLLRRGRKLDLATLLEKGLKDLENRLTPAHLLNFLFRARAAYIPVKRADFRGFKKYLAAQVAQTAEQWLAAELKPALSALLEEQVRAIRDAPQDWLKRPVFDKATIPFMQADREVYQLQFAPPNTPDWSPPVVRFTFYTRSYVKHLMEGDEEKSKNDNKKARNGEKNPPSGGSGAKGVPLAAEYWFTLRTPERFRAMQDRGFVPALGVLKWELGHKLVLTLAFERGRARAEPDEANHPQVKYVAGIDLGLKHYAAISLAQFAYEAETETWVPATPLNGEFARFFLDDKQLTGKRSQWFLPVETKKKQGCYLSGTDYTRLNLKGKLRQLQHQVKHYQTLMTRYRDRHRQEQKADGTVRRYCHKWRYFLLRRAWKRCWRRLLHLHEEIARQVATRIVALCEAYGVTEIRLEDLKWAEHSAKMERGYWIATWQVHWFHASIAQRIKWLAELKGLQVVQVNAKNTSKRCWKCHELGKRLGKRFICKNPEHHSPRDPAKPYTVDADLNAARNILTAPETSTTL